MKKQYFLIGLLFFFVSCLSNKKEKEQSVQSVVKQEKITPKKEKPKVDYSLKKEECGKSFEVFFEQFGKDPTFQKSRVQYPLKWFYHGNTDYDKLISENVTMSDYRFFDFSKDEEAKNREYGAFEINRIEYKDSLIYQRDGLDTGLHIQFKFKKVDGCWLLVEILDEST